MRSTDWGNPPSPTRPKVDMAPKRDSIVSPFIRCGVSTKDNELAVLHLKRDLLIPTVLRSEDTKNEGYDEGKVTNTRFGSFPHSTLIDVPWGSQVRASVVDTGSRGRREGNSKKRKRADALQGCEENPAIPRNGNAITSRTAATEASSGFIHVLPPTPETWTASLPHRTQVVYTPDYSYILQRIRARPGTRLIEAGAGSGSFTHAAARAVFNGYQETQECSLHDRERSGKLWSFEFHEQRSQRLKQELLEHGLDSIVELTHRDVCGEGFLPETTSAGEMKVNAVFLDLPAPWLALKYLTRDIDSPLDPNTAVHVCTFSPCIEQIQKTISTLRQFGWLEVEMIEIAAKRIEVRRERVGLQEEGLRGVNDSPATVDEALTRLREIEGRSKSFREVIGKDSEDASLDSPIPQQHISKQQRLANIRDAQEGRKLYKEGRLITKAEPELKTHTSYLVFAVLPRSWSENDEKAAQDACANGPLVEASAQPPSKRQRRKAAKDAAEGYVANKEANLDRADESGTVQAT